MLDRNFDAINVSDILGLIDNEAPESRSLDYKRDLPDLSENNSKREFLADVSAFANSGGGTLIFGIDEGRDEEGRTTGKPLLHGAEIENEDELVKKLQNICDTGISPKIVNLRMKSFSIGEDKVFLVQVPNSWSAPHMVTFKKKDSFYARNNSGKYPLDIGDLRSAFLLSDSQAQQIKNFRLERLNQISTGTGPTKIATNGPQVVLQLLPLQSFSHPQPNIDLTHIQDERGLTEPIHYRSNRCRLNLDGFLTFTLPGQDGTHSSYCQVFRDGKIETAASGLISENLKGRKILYPRVEEKIIGFVKRAITLLTKLGVAPPVYLFLSILNVKDYVMTHGQMGEPSDPIDRDNLLFPEILIDDFAKTPDTIVRPVLDQLWNACGFERCENYKNEVWIRP